MCNITCKSACLFGVCTLSFNWVCNGRKVNVFVKTTRQYNALLLLLATTPFIHQLKIIAYLPTPTQQLRDHEGGTPESVRANSYPSASAATNCFLFRAPRYMYRAPKKKDYLYPETQNICPIELLVVVAAELLLLLLLSSSANYKFNMTSANSASSKIFWGMDPPAGGPQDPQARATICKQDHGWIQKAAFETPDGSVVTVKAGNKLYGLTASTKSDYNPDRIYATELGLFRKYRYTKITNIHTSKQIYIFIF